MSAPFSYAQAASKAPVPAQPQPLVQASGRNADTSVPHPHITGTAPTQNMAEPVASSASVESVITGTKPTEIDTKPAAPLVPEKTMAKTTVNTPTDTAKEQPKRVTADEETASMHSRSRSALNGTVKPSSDRSSSAGKSSEPRQGRKGKNAQENSQDIQQPSLAEDQEIVEMIDKSVPPVELTPAPLPTVNPWHKKTHMGSHPAVNGNATQPIAANGPTPKASSTHSLETGNGATQAPPVKALDETRIETQPRKTVARVTRPEKEEKKNTAHVTPPSNDDPRSWPTLALEEAKSQFLQSQPPKTERVEGAAAAGGKKKQWKKVELEHQPYQPPNMGRGRGRGGNRGGRDSGTRGGSNAANSQTHTTSGAPAVKGASEGRPRAHDSNVGRNANGARSSNSPGGTKRTPGGEAGPRKQSATSARDSPEGYATSKNKAEPVQNEVPNSATQANGKQQGYIFPKDSQQAQSGRDRESGRNERGSRGGFRGRGNHGGSSHGHSHSHSHSHSQNFPGTNVHGYPANTSRAGPFSPTNSMPMGAGHAGGRRMPSRGSFTRSNPQAGQLAGASTGHVTGGMNGSAHRAPPVMTDAYSSYPASQPLSAPPYPTPQMQQPSYDDPALDVTRLIVLTKQIDFYFSVDNLIKDIWFRKNMDSQGFVHLGLICSFPRVRTITVSADDIRNAVSHSQQVDLYCAPDGIERIRSRKSCEQFIYPYEERFPPGQTDRDDLFLVHAENAQYPFSSMTPGNSSQFYQTQSFPQSPMEAAHPFQHNYGGPPVQYPAAYAMSGHTSQRGTSLMADAPEFSPTNGTSAGTNGTWAGVAHGTSTHVTNGVSNGAPNGNGATDDQAQA